MSGASQSQPGNRAALSACCNACDVTCCPSGACASTVGSSSKSITSTNPRSAMSHRPSPLNPGSALRICGHRGATPRLQTTGRGYASCPYLKCIEHKAPTLPLIRPLSLQDPIRSSKFIRWPKYFVNVDNRVFMHLRAGVQPAPLQNELLHAGGVSSKSQLYAASCRGHLAAGEWLHQRLSMILHNDPVDTVPAICYARQSSGADSA